MVRLAATFGKGPRRGKEGEQPWVEEAITSTGRVEGCEVAEDGVPSFRGRDASMTCAAIGTDREWSLSGSLCSLWQVGLRITVRGSERILSDGHRTMLGVCLRGHVSRVCGSPSGRRAGHFS